jgi:hypothetical protein
MGGDLNSLPYIQIWVTLWIKGYFSRDFSPGMMGRNLIDNTPIYMGRCLYSPNCAKDTGFNLGYPHIPNPYYGY